MKSISHRLIERPAPAGTLQPGDIIATTTGSVTVSRVTTATDGTGRLEIGFADHAWTILLHPNTLVPILVDLAKSKGVATHGA